MFIFGRLLADRRFDGIGCYVSNFEDDISMNYLFDFITETASRLPIAIMSDAAPAITKSLKQKMKKQERLMCWAHVMEKVTAKLSPVRALDPDMSRAIQDDIRIIQAGSLDENMFILLLSLFQRKWTGMTMTNSTLKEKVLNFITYFLKVWGRDSDTRKWFQGANPQSSSTNNANESQNNVFKQDFTDRKRLSIPDLFDKLFEMMKEWDSKKPVPKA